MVYLLMFLSGAAAALPLLFPKLFFLSWFAVAPLIAVMIRRIERGMTRRGAYFMGFTWFGGYFFSIYHWFCYLYPMKFLGLSPVMAVLTIAVCWVGLTALQTFQMGFVTLGFRLVCRRRWTAPLLFAFCWMIGEWAQTKTWMGVPWARLSLSQTSFLPNIQSASLFGSITLSGVIVLCNGLIALAALAVIEKKRRIRALPLALAALMIVAVNSGYGAIRLNSLNHAPKGEPVRVALIQGNISTDDKWAPGMTEQSLELYLQMTRYAYEDYQPDLILLPETVIPTKILNSKAMTGAVRSCARELGCVIVVGAFTGVENEKEGDIDTYNSLITFNADGSISEEIYSKRRLVPFGEFLPMEDFFRTFLPVLADLGNLGGNLTAGRYPNIISTDVGSLGALICFDSIYETLTLDSVRDGAQLLLLSTNDSWYRDSAAVYQHNAHAKLRAVETGRWVARAANTGVSSIIMPSGEVTGELEPLVTGNVYGEVYLSDEVTPYVMIGNVGVYLAFVGCAIAYFSEKLAAAIKKSIE